MYHDRGGKFGSSVIGLAMATAVVAAGCSGGEATTEPSAPTPTIGSTAPSSDYDLVGRDATAICVQLKVFADRWDATPPAGATAEANAAAARENVEQMVTAAAKLQALAPPALVEDIQEQVLVAQGLVAQFMPSASVTVSVPPGPSKDLKAVGEAQQRINALTQPSCGFKIWD